MSELQNASPVRQAISCSVSVLPSGSSNPAYLTPPPTSRCRRRLRHARSTRAGLVNVIHDQVQALDSPGAHVGEPGRPVPSRIEQAEPGGVSCTMRTPGEG